MGDLQELTDRIKKFNQERDWDQFHNPKDLLIALISEVGELADLYRWLSPEEMEKVHQDPESFAKIESEMADMFAFLLMLSYKTGVDLKGALEKKYAKLEHRYPVDKSKGVHSNQLEGFKGK